MLGEFALLASVDPLHFSSGSWCSCLVRMLQWADIYNEFHGLFGALHASIFCCTTTFVFEVWKMLYRCWLKGADLNCFLFSSPGYVFLDPGLNADDAVVVCAWLPSS
ncbi:hypothetical protein Nepgr_030003 [Nepenthes gracilis]|uniref:Uncharacterized protein n=1 Tax=Nepenthes gracilis TaxID=150966 RepID=A0AAD3TDR9_NEPGR|nr:hypothetical protein Nepgr_030003 [Nepenthes gracilis]